MLGSTFRPAETSDCRWLWQLREHPSVAKQSLNANPIPYLKHCRWFRKFISSSDRQLDIFTGNESALRLGFIRSEPFNDGLILSWAVVPEHHGKGIGKAMLGQWCCQTQIPLWAQIKPTNTPSKALAASIGFNLVIIENNLELWKLNKGAFFK